MLFTFSDTLSCTFDEMELDYCYDTDTQMDDAFELDEDDSME